MAITRRPIAISAPTIATTTSPTGVEDRDMGVAAFADEEGTTEVVVCKFRFGTLADTETLATLYSDNVNECPQSKTDQAHVRARGAKIPPIEGLGQAWVLVENPEGIECVVTHLPTILPLVFSREYIVGKIPTSDALLEISDQTPLTSFS